jgi:hypothetical protein
MGNRNDRQRGERWARELGLDQCHALIDALVLGDFDWREWLDDKPSNAFVSAAFDEAQYREECECPY